MAERVGSLTYKSNKFDTASFIRLTNKMANEEELQDKERRFVLENKKQFEERFRQIHETYGKLKITETTGMYLRYHAWLEYKHNHLNGETKNDVDTFSEFDRKIRDFFNNAGAAEITAARTLIKTYHFVMIEETGTKVVVNYSELDSRKYHVRFMFNSQLVEEKEKELKAAEARRSPESPSLTAVLDKLLDETAQQGKEYVAAEKERDRVVVKSLRDEKEIAEFNRKSTARITAVQTEIARFNNERLALMSPSFNSKEFQAAMQTLLPVIAMQQTTKGKEDEKKQLQENFKKYLAKLDNQINESKEFEKKRLIKEKEKAKRLIEEIFEEYSVT